MSVAILERESGQREVLVDSFDDLLLVRDGLLLIKQQSDNPEDTDHIQALRDEVVDDITETMEGTRKEERYIFSEAEAALIGTARAIALKAREADSKVLQQTRTLAPSSASTSRRVVHQRITSFNDPRLDEKPRRWFRR